MLCEHESKKMLKGKSENVLRQTEMETQHTKFMGEVNSNNK